MGLDTSHDCFHGAYGGFKRFRDAVAAAAKEHYDYEPDYENHPLRAFLGWWDHDDAEAIRYNLDRGFKHHPYSHPLDVFFIHSDCEGYIFPQDAGVLADALEPLIGYLPPTPANKSYASRQRLWDFINGLRKAHEHWEVIEFR